MSMYKFTHIQQDWLLNTPWVVHDCANNFGIVIILGSRVHLPHHYIKMRNSNSLAEHDAFLIMLAAYVAESVI